MTEEEKTEEIINNFLSQRKFYFSDLDMARDLIKIALAEGRTEQRRLQIAYSDVLEKENAELKDKLEHGKQLDFNISIGNERFIKRIEQLEKENAELKEKIETYEIQYKLMFEAREKNEAQIEKMKNCPNCKHKNDSNTDYYCEDCKRFAYETDTDKWELAE